MPGLEEIAAAVPLTSAGGIAPGARGSAGRGSMITYLAFDGAPSFARQTRLGRDYIASAPVPAGASAGLTGWNGSFVNVCDEGTLVAGGGVDVPPPPEGGGVVPPPAGGEAAAGQAVTV